MAVGVGHPAAAYITPDVMLMMRPPAFITIGGNLRAGKQIDDINRQNPRHHQKADITEKRRRIISHARLPSTMRPADE